MEPELIGGECSYWACMPSKALLRPGELYDETRRVPGVAEAVTGAARRGRRAGPPRRGRARLRRLRPGRVAGRQGRDAGPRPRAAGRRAPRARGRRRAGGAQGGDPGHRQRRELPADRRTGRGPRPWRQPRGHGRQGGAERGWPSWAAAWSGCEMARRLALAGRPGHAHRGLGPPARARGALRRRSWSRRRCAMQGRGRALRRQGHVRAPQRRRRGGGRPSRTAPRWWPTSCWWPPAACPTPTTSGVDSVGLEPGKYIDVDDQMRATGVDGDWLYALGDVNGRVLLTHMGKYQARAAADVILGGDAAVDHDGTISPRVIFTDPQVAAVGHTTEAAIAEGLNVRVVDRQISMNAGASFYGRNTPSQARLVVDEDRKVIVGADLRGLRGRRLPARRHHRGGRPGAAGHALARHPVVPHAKRDLAQPVRGVRLLGSVDGRCHRRRTRTDRAAPDAAADRAGRQRPGADPQPRSRCRPGARGGGGGDLRPGARRRPAPVRRGRRRGGVRRRRRPGQRARAQAHGGPGRRGQAHGRRRQPLRDGQLDRRGRPRLRARVDAPVPGGQGRGRRDPGPERPGLHDRAARAA